MTERLDRAPTGLQTGYKSKKGAIFRIMPAKFKLRGGVFHDRIPVPAAPPDDAAPVIAPEANADLAAPGGINTPNIDLGWVWREVRKRVFIKLPFSLGVADAMEAIVPITLDKDAFVVGLAPRDYPLSSHLNIDAVRNTIENILRQAAGRTIKFEVIEGVSIDDWDAVVERRSRAQDAVIAMASQKAEDHHFEDVLNQIVGEIRQRVTSVRDRILPQVRARLILDIVPSLADAEEMLFPEPDSHESKRAMARVIDRVAGFLEVPPLTLALEIERHRRASYATPPKSATPSE